MPKAKPYQSISIFGNTARYTQSCNYIHTRVRNMGVSVSTFLSLIQVNTEPNFHTIFQNLF